MPSEPLHIVLVTSWYPSVEHPFVGAFVQAQAHALASAGCKVGVVSVEFCSGDTHDASREDQGVYVHQHCTHAITPNDKRRFWLDGYPRVQRRLFEDYIADHGRPDIVNIEGLWPGGRLLPWLTKNNILCVITEHSEEYLPQSTRKLLRTPFMLWGVLRPLTKHAISYSAPSQFLAQSLANAGLAKSADSVRIIPNVVPVRETSAYPQEEVKRFVHVSSFSPAKNMERMIDAFKLVVGEMDNLKLELIGDSEFRAGVEQLVSARKLNDYVDFCGYLNGEEIAQHLNNSVAAVISSDYETFSSFAAEALMAGRPVLTTACGGPQEFIDNSRGITSAERTIEAFAQAWKEMAASYASYDPNALHAYAREHFAPAQVAAQFIAWYQEVLREQA